VGSMSLRLQLAAESVVIVGGLEGERIHGHRRTVLLEDQQLAVVIEKLRVGGAAAEAGDARIVGSWISVHPEQRLPCGMLRLPTLCAGVAGAVVDVPVLEAEHAHMPLAVETDVVAVLRGFRVLRVGADTEKCAIQVGWQLPIHLAVEQFVFRAVHTAPRTATAAEPAWVGREEHLRFGRTGRQGSGYGDARTRYGGAREKPPTVEARTRVAVVGIRT